jgi:hypothetical protein
MVTESLFGMLTASGVMVLPYVLFSWSGVTAEETIGNVILIALLAAAPMAVAQTQVGIANGSAYYQVENWVPLLAGLLGDAIVYATYSAWNGGWFKAPPALFTDQATASGGAPSTAANAPIIYLLVAATVGVPILQMAAINLFKQPRVRPYASIDPRGGVALRLPAPMPVVTVGSSGPTLGMGVALLRGTF